MDLKGILMNEKIKKEEAIDANYDCFSIAIAKIKTTKFTDSTGNTYDYADLSALTMEDRKNIIKYHTAVLLDSVYTEYIRKRAETECPINLELDFMLKNYTPIDWDELSKNKRRKTKVFNQLIPVDEDYENLDTMAKKEYLFSIYDKVLNEKGYTNTNIRKTCLSLMDEMEQSTAKIHQKRLNSSCHRLFKDE